MKVSKGSTVPNIFLTLAILQCKISQTGQGTFSQNGWEKA
jgi:hypothetical protein